MIFDYVLKLMSNPNQNALGMSLNDCHIKGCFSLVIDGELNDEGELKHGTLTRVFIATKKIKPFDIQFHSYRYDLSIGVVNGCFEHHIAEQDYSDHFYDGHSVKLKEFEYKSPLNGGTGLKENGVGVFKIKSNQVPVGAELCLPHDLIHTVSASKGTIWIVKEHGFVSDSSVVLGTSFQTEGLYNKPEQFQVNDMFTLVYDKLKKLVEV